MRCEGGRRESSKSRAGGREEGNSLRQVQANRLSRVLRVDYTHALQRTMVTASTILASQMEDELMRLNFTKGQRFSTTMMATKPPFLSHLTGVSGERQRMSRSIALLPPSFLLLLCDGVPCLIYSSIGALHTAPRLQQHEQIARSAFPSNSHRRSSFPWYWVGGRSDPYSVALRPSHPLLPRSVLAEKQDRRRATSPGPF